MDNNDNRPLWLRPWFWLVALFFIGRRKKEKQATKITYYDKKPLKTVITTVFSGLLMFVFKLMATNG
ncbi:hypothetical protein BKY29_10355 [Weissella confusa]|uniref:hypothetical protein n=1 Tax=Weissella confusa TaxID=1583 RepID=UPI0008FE4570|nr:hypothetical protein [Weissella confusa]OJF02745.1 hypothetical protein BKY29_10355 [Weissella confusa]